jgi:hypothetical protein
VGETRQWRKRPHQQCPRKPVPTFATVTDLAPALLLGATALVLHLASLTTLVAYFRDVPERWWVRMWVTPAWLPRTGVRRWLGVIFAAVIAAMATYLMAAFLTGGAHMTFGAVELVAVSAWLWHLVSARRDDGAGET